MANSSRAFHTVTVTTALPWAGEVPELIDELAGEKLPAALMDPILEERRARHAERRAAAAAQAQARVAELEPRMDELSAAELDELDQLNVVAHGEYSAKAWRFRDKLRARRKALIDAGTDPAAPPAEPDEAVERVQAGAPDAPVEVAEADEPAASANSGAE